jgi:HK97 family phage major capsid protein
MSYQDRIKTLRTEVQKLVNDAKTMYAELETKGDQATADDRAKLNNLIDDGQVKRAELVRLEELEAADRHLNEPAAEPKARANGPIIPERKSWGQLVIESPEFKRADKNSSTPQMDRVNVKALYGSTDASGGALLQTYHEPDVIGIPQRPQSILDMITVVQTTADAVEYAVLASRTNNAAPVAEFTAGNFGLKPESDMTWTLATVLVRTIATWVAASRRILADVPGLRTIVDVDLTTMLRIVLENEIISGAGTGEHFLGILNTTGILTRPQGAGGTRGLAGDTVADTLRRAITDVLLQFYTPNAIVLNPTDAEAIELSKDTTNQYIETFDPATGRLWRIAVAQTAALTAKTAIVGDLAMGCRLWDREQTEIRVGEPNDFFLRNAVAVLAELRAAFAVIRPAAIEKVTLT